MYFTCVFQLIKTIILGYFSVLKIFAPQMKYNSKNINRTTPSGRCWAFIYLLLKSFWKGVTGI